MTSARRTGLPMVGVHRRPTQPGVDAGRGDLARADRLHGRARTSLAVSAGEHARNVGHQGLRVRDDEAARAFDSAAFENREVGALARGQDHVVGFELQQSGGIELRIELAVLVLDLLAELEGDLAILFDAHRSPARVQLYPFGHRELDLVRAGRHVAALLERGEVHVRSTLP